MYMRCVASTHVTEIYMYSEYTCICIASTHVYQIYIYIASDINISQSIHVHHILMSNVYDEDIYVIYVNLMSETYTIYIYIYNEYTCISCFDVRYI